MLGGQQRIDVRRTHDCSIIYKSLTVVLDCFDVVEVVHHDAEQFLDVAREAFEFIHRPLVRPDVFADLESYALRARSRYDGAAPLLVSSSFASPDEL